MTTPTIARLGLCAALGAVLAALWCAPAARADAQGFLTDVTDLGFSHPSGAAGLLSHGYAVCQMLSVPGVDGYDAAREIYVNTGFDVDWNDSANFVIASVVNLCPEYDNRSQSVA